MSEQQTEDPYQRQAELSAQETASHIGIQRQQEQVSKRKFNPDFFEQTSDLDVDTELFDWLENELGAKGSRAHVLGNRPESFEEQQDLLNRNLAERMISEREPGYLIKKNPAVMAVYQEVDSLDDPDAVAPITQSRERRQYRNLAEVLTTRETLAIDGEFVDALTTATTETRQHAQQEDESSGTTKRLRSVFK